MRRILVIVSALLISTLVATPVAAAGRTFHLSFSGRGAEAQWTNAPLDGTLIPNVVYTDVYLSVSQEAVDEEGTTYSDTYLFIDSFSYKIDRRGNWSFVSEVFGDASGDAVSLTVDRKLTRATASATVTIVECTASRCAEAGTAQVSATWVGSGSLTHSGGTYHSSSKDYTFTEHFKGTARNATATGQMDGTSFGPSIWYAAIYDSTDSYIDISH